MSSQRASTKGGKCWVLLLICSTLTFQSCSTLRNSPETAASSGGMALITTGTFEEGIRAFCNAPGPTMPATDTVALKQPSGGVTILEQIEGSAFLRRVNVPAMRCVLRDSTEWNLIRPMFAGTSWAARHFDFANVQVVVAAYGVTGTTGPRIRVSSIANRRDLIEVHVLTVQPPDCIAGDMTISPFAAAVFPRSANSVRFKDWVVDESKCP